MSTYDGLTVVNFWPLLLWTNSLLMNRPNGCVHFFPFGAVNETSMPEDPGRRVRTGEVVKGRPGEA
jgi:hypothetical protein